MSEVRFPFEWSPEGACSAELLLQYAEVYKDSVEMLLNGMQPRELLHDYQPLPMLFLFRHYIELQLKGLILQMGGEFDPDPDHNLTRLLDTLKGLGSELHLPLCSDIIPRLQNLDAKSTTFRYPFSKDMKRFFQKIGDEKLYMMITTPSSMSKLITDIITELENAEGYCDAARENSDCCQEDVKEGDDAGEYFGCVCQG